MRIDLSAFPGRCGQWEVISQRESDCRRGRRLGSCTWSTFHKEEEQKHQRGSKRREQGPSINFSLAMGETSPLTRDWGRVWRRLCNRCRHVYFCLFIPFSSFMKEGGCFLFDWELETARDPEEIDSGYLSCTSSAPQLIIWPWAHS